MTLEDMLNDNEAYLSHRPVISVNELLDILAKGLIRKLFYAVDYILKE